MSTRFVSVFAALFGVTMLVLAAGPDTRLSVAAMNGDAAEVQKLLNAGARLNDAQGDGMTALHWAASRGDLAITKLLLDARANVNLKTRLNEMTPLFMAARSGSAPVVTALLKAGADAKSASTVGTTALMLAAASGNVDTVQALIKAGAPVNAKDVYQGQTALMFAAAVGRADVIRVLAANGADVNFRSLVPTRLAPKANGRDAFLQDNLEPPAGAAGVRGAAGAGGARGRGAALAKPLALGGMSAMHFAVREGHIDAVRALVESGADINEATASDRMTTLTLAITNGRFDIGKYLLERGADPTPASTEEATALFSTIDVKWSPTGWYPAPVVDNESVDYLDLVRLLLDRGADVNARMNGRMWMRIIGPGGGPVYTGETAFLRAAQANDVAGMKLLISRGADPNITTTKGINALMYAAGPGHRPQESRVKPDSRVATVRYLVEDLGFDVNFTDKDGFASLHGAASVGDKDVILYLASKGADVKKRANVFLGGAPNAAAPTTGLGETIADMANGPGEKTLVYPEIVDLLVQMGSEFSDNCRAAVCVNKSRNRAVPPPRPPSPPEPKKP